MTNAPRFRRRILGEQAFLFLCSATACVILAAAGALTASAQTWRPMGPPGGDVRSLAADPSDPRRLFLGTTDGHVFRSMDGGDHWELAGRAGPHRDAVLTTLVIDPRGAHVLYAAAWTLDSPAGGGVFRSDDDGRTWRSAGLQGQAVRALSLASRADGPSLLVAGTLDGVYRSLDGGSVWQRITPQGDEELRNVDSVTIDSRDPEIIYAGTYHLPWKTSDGGRHWLPIHEGMIDDSDVMSMIVDRANPHRLYASACSGIYRSENAGGVWKKIQGIPYTARRTHVIRQDARHPQVVYAGTTEGLWKTVNGGTSWQRVTPASWVINTLEIASAERGPERVMIGTEQLGVLRSDDGGKSFRAANEGFNHRQIISLALDPARPARVLAVLTGAPEPVLTTDDGGRSWKPLGPGLATEGLKRVYSSPDGWWAALERGGLMRYDAQKGEWIRAGIFSGGIPEEVSRREDGRKRLAVRSAPQPLAQIVNDMAFAENTWFAATEETLLASHDRGATWTSLPLGPVHLPTRSVRVSLDGQRLWVVSLRGMVFSLDGGKSWSWRDLPGEAGAALRLDTVNEQTFLATAANALYISRDAGRAWQKAARGLPSAPLQGLAVIGNVILASMESGGLYLSRDLGATWERIEGTLAEGFFPVVTTTLTAETLYAASSTDSLYAVDLRPEKPEVSVPGADTPTGPR